MVDDKPARDGTAEVVSRGTRWVNLDGRKSRGSRHSCLDHPRERLGRRKASLRLLPTSPHLKMEALEVVDGEHQVSAQITSRRPRTRTPSRPVKEPTHGKTAPRHRGSPGCAAGNDTFHDRSHQQTRDGRHMRYTVLCSVGYNAACWTFKPQSGRSSCSPIRSIRSGCSTRGVEAGATWRMMTRPPRRSTTSQAKPVKTSCHRAGRIMTLMGCAIDL